MEIFADSEERHVHKKFLCVKMALSEVRKVSANEIFLISDKGVFSAHAKPPDNEKTHFSTARLRLPTASKLTSNCKFYPQKPTVSLQYTFSFSKNISLASAVQLPFRTDSKPFHRRFAGKTGFDTCRRKFLRSLFRQSFESSPESRGSQTSGVLFGSFCTTQKARKTSPSQGASRFCKPRNSAPQ